MKTTEQAQQRKKSSSSKSKQATSTNPRSKQRYRATPKRNRLWFWGGGSLILVLLIVLVATLVIRSQASSTADGTGNIAGVVTFSNLSRDHVSSKVAYPQVPPVGGSHNPVWLNCGIYNQPVINENAVHSMEHGAVWITYQPSLAQQDIDQLKSLARGHSYMLVSPYPNLPSPVVISAWGLQLQVKSASDARLAQFISRYEQGPQTPEKGSPCSGGIGTPDEQ